MNIKILEILEENKYILFNSQHGSGIGRWAGSPPPKINEVYNVEFNIEFILSLDNCNISNNETGKISIIEQKLHINGKIEFIDDDGMVFLRLSRDCLLMIESESNFNIGTWLSFFVEKEKVDVYLT